MESKLKIIEEKENPLFRRKEIKILVEAGITPSISDAEKLVSEKFSKPKEHIKIKSIKGNFGTKTFLISANIYASEKDLKKTEPEPKKKKEKSSAPKEASESK